MLNIEYINHRAALKPSFSHSPTLTFVSAEARKKHLRPPHKIGNSPTGIYALIPAGLSHASAESRLRLPRSGADQQAFIEPNVIGGAMAMAGTGGIVAPLRHDEPRDDGFGPNNLKRHRNGTAGRG